MRTSRDDLYRMVQECLTRKDLAGGRRAHSLMVSNGLQGISVIGDHLIRLFTLCKSLQDVNLVFCDIAKPTLHTWHAIISAHELLGHPERALELYYQMQQDGTRPSKHILSYVLKVCGGLGALRQGKLVHEQIVEEGHEIDLVVGTAVVNMYAKCGKLEEAHMVFDCLSNKDVVLWNSLIAGYTQQGHSLIALDLYVKMQQGGLKPNDATFLSLLNACASINDIRQGRLLHDQIVKNEVAIDVVTGSTIIDMYAKCGSLDEAQKMFNVLPSRNLVSWNMMVTAHAQHGHGILALELLEGMLLKGIQGDVVTYTSSLKACGNTRALWQIRLIHDKVIRTGIESDLILGNSLIDAYAKCGLMVEAYRILTLLPGRDAISWNALLSGCLDYGYSHSVLYFFGKMQLGCVKPTNVTYICILKACTNAEALNEGMLIHDEILKSDVEKDDVVANALVALYALCGSLKDASKIFESLPNKDPTSWAIMITGYSHHGQGYRALKLFQKMQQEGLKPNKDTFVGALKACDTPKAIGQGRLIHSHIMSYEFRGDDIIRSSLMYMYINCGSLEDAHKVFNNLPNQTAVIWNAMISSYIQCGECGLPIFKAFKEMLEGDVKPDRVTYLYLLKACSNTGAKWQGLLIHDQLVESSFDLDMFVGTALVDMYLKCGSFNEAQKTFNILPFKSLVSWNALISGYAEHGNCCKVEQILQEMQMQGLQPDARTYTSVLSSCNHAGEKDKGCQFLESMREQHGIMPSPEHFNCMVDLFACAGLFTTAEELLKTMPLCPDISSWKSMLASSWMYGNKDFGTSCFSEASV